MEMQELIDKLNNETPDNYSACSLKYTLQT